VIVHRIELQKTEREILEGYATAQGVGSILSGVGNILNPFSTAISAFVAAWIAKEGIENVWKWANDKLNEKDKKLSADYLAYLDAYNSVPVELRSPNAGPPMSEAEYKKKFEKDYKTRWDKFSDWMSPTADMTGQTGDPTGLGLDPRMEY